MKISVVIPTLDRGPVLLQTVRAVLSLEPRSQEVVVVDQTRVHDPDVERALGDLHSRGDVTWLRLQKPSIPASMNLGLSKSVGEVVLFLDDDVEPSPGLLEAHISAHRRGRGEIVAGQVLQPGEVPEPLSDAEFHFRSSTEQYVAGFMGGNFSVLRSEALVLRGFDEHFVRAAYRFEAEFADRARLAGLRIWFEPSASLRHLRAPSGGTRSHGEHLRTLRPGHAVGEYYYLLRRRPSRYLAGLLSRPLRSVRTRHHLMRPWWIPVTLAAELLGFLWALSFAARPPKLLPVPEPIRATH